MTEWIKCSDSLPEEYDKCLIFDGVNISIDYIVKFGKEKIWAKTALDDIKQSKICYWMPLPESPKDE